MSVSEEAGGDKFQDHPLSLSKSQSKEHENDVSTYLSSSPSYEASICTTGSGSTVVTTNSLQGPAAARATKLALDGSALQGECFAPPGKLGVAIDTVSGHPVVHRVREDSPLSGVLRRLDVIIAVDEVDTTNMNAADVTSLVAKRMDATRKIRFLRGKASEDCLAAEK